MDFAVALLTFKLIQYVRRTQQGKMQVIENTIKTSGQTGADMESERWEVRTIREFNLITSLTFLETMKMMLV